MNAACCVLCASKGSSASPSRSGGTNASTSACSHWRAESVHSIARVTMAIPPQHISKH